MATMLNVKNFLCRKKFSVNRSKKVLKSYNAQILVPDSLKIEIHLGTKLRKKTSSNRKK